MLLSQRRDPATAASLRQGLDQAVLPACTARSLPVDDAVTRCGAALPVPDPQPCRAEFIAATALGHSLVPLTRNRLDGIATAVRSRDPWWQG